MLEVIIAQVELMSNPIIVLGLMRTLTIIIVIPLLHIAMGMVTIIPTTVVDLTILIGIRLLIMILIIITDTIATYTVIETSSPRQYM